MCHWSKRPLPQRTFTEWFSNRLVHSFNQQIFTEHLPGIRDTAVNKTGKNHVPHGVHILEREEEESDLNQKEVQGGGTFYREWLGRTC